MLLSWKESAEQRGGRMGDIIDCLNSFHHISAKKKHDFFFWSFAGFVTVLPYLSFCITVCTHTVQTYLPVFLQTLSAFDIYYKLLLSFFRSIFFSSSHTLCQKALMSSAAVFMLRYCELLSGLASFCLSFCSFFYVFTTLQPSRMHDIFMFFTTGSETLCSFVLTDIESVTHSFILGLEIKLLAIYMRLFGPENNEMAVTVIINNITLCYILTKIL